MRSALLRGTSGYNPSVQQSDIFGELPLRLQPLFQDTSASGLCGGPVRARGVGVWRGVQEAQSGSMILHCGASS